MHTHRPVSKRKWIILTAVILFICTIASMSFQNAFDRFGHLRITITNQSDLELVDVKAGLIRGDNSMNNVDNGTLYEWKQNVPSGKKVKFAPQLQLSGEGAVYLEFTDSQGKMYNRTVCGYTESLSGNSYVTVTNDNVTVKEECM
ncbi:hypothetical protein [Paenibacillus pabuli]|uniref:hypothetical protein n=1 Tax=Paenibacillus pabuli TaxID=1472 RepID=UPI003CF16152